MFAHKLQLPFIFPAARNVDDDPFKSLHVAVVVVDPLPNLQHPFPHPRRGSNLVFFVDGAFFRKEALPLPPEFFPVFGGDEFVEGEVPVPDEAVGAIARKFAASVRDELHGPVPVVSAPVGHAREVGEEDGLAPLAFPQGYLGRLPGRDVLHQADVTVSASIAEPQPGHGHIHPDHGPVRSDVPLFHGIALDLPGLKGGVILQVFFHIIRMGYPGPSEAEEVLPGPARYFFKRGVDDRGKVFPGTEGILAEGEGNTDGRLFEDGLKQGGAFLQSFLDQPLHSVQFEMGFHPDPEGFKVDGFPDVILRTQFQAPDFLVELVVIGQDKKGSLHGGFSGFQLLEELEAVHVGHVEVQDDEIEIGVRFDHLEGLDAVAGGEDFKIGQHVPDNHAVCG